MKKKSKASSSGSNEAGHIGGNAFPDNEPVCKPSMPGRRPKPLSGPVHPGFPKANSRYAKKTPNKMNTSPTIGSGIRIADQNYDLYQSKPKTKKSVAKKVSANKGRQKK